MFEDDHTLGFDTGKAAEWMQERFRGSGRSW